MAERQIYYKIAISGDLGSGKSTISKLLQQKLLFNRYSMGEAWRNLAAKYNMTILELNKYSETHPLDEEMDHAMAAQADAPRNIIFDSRLAWHFIPGSFKVHLTVNPLIAATRIFNDKRNEEGYADITEAYEKINQRKISENNRYIQKYGLDCSQYQNYDLVIDTSYATPESIATVIITAFKAWTGREFFNGHWISPRSPFPTRDIQKLDRIRVGEIIGSIATDGFMGRNPVLLLMADGFYYIYEGHGRTSAALRTGIELIPAKIIAVGLEKLPDGIIASDYIYKTYNQQNVRLWEELHHFKYPQYPSF